MRTLDCHSVSTLILGTTASDWLSERRVRAGVYVEMRSDRYNGVLLCTAPCMSVNTLNSIRCAMGSQWSSRSAAVMLRWSRRSIHRTTRAAARCTISSRCSSVPVIPNNAAFPKSSVDVTSACTSVLHANAAFSCGGIDGKLGGLTPMNS